MALSDNTWALGMKLKNIRTKLGYTLTDAASSAGFSPQFLSMVENGKCGISFPKLESLLSFYGLSLADLVEKESSGYSVVHVDQMPKMNSFFDGIETYLVFDQKVGDKQRTNVTLFRLPPGTGTQKWKHEGYEFIFVLDGVLDVYMMDPDTGREETYTLGQWDSIQHPSNVEHHCANNTSKEVSFIVGTLE